MSVSLWQSLSDRAKNMIDTAFDDVDSAESWLSAKKERKRQFMDSMGLDPLPAKCDPAIIERGELSGEGFRVRKIAYQIIPDCWGTSAIYYPDPMPKEASPGILYVCGHSATGSHYYQSHPIMWAKRGYVCLIIDSIEQNDNPGEHCGLHLDHYINWLSMGYTAAGGEVFNAIRALDVLSADENVDSERLGVTGVSGGGACSFHLAVADERIKAVSTLCGICSPYDAIENRHMINHCDCMFPLNVYQKDISEHAALIAPRAAQFCFAEQDVLYSTEETKGVAERAKKIYTLLGEEDKWNIVEDPGTHGDHLKFDEETTKWFDKHIAGEMRPAIPRGEDEFTESETSVFNGTLPKPDRLELLPQLICDYGTISLPRDKAEWPPIREKALNTLRTKVPGLSCAKKEKESTLSISEDWRYHGDSGNSALCLHRGEIEEVGVWLHTTTPKNAAKKIILGICAEEEYSVAVMGKVGCSIDTEAAGYGAFEPRVAGGNLPVEIPDNFPTGSRMPPIRKLMIRGISLLGTTPVMMTIHDIGVALNAISAFDETKDSEIYLYGRGDSGVAALYRGLIDERVKGVILEDAPGSHRDGSPIIGVLKAFDLHQAIGLMAPRKVALVTQGHKRCMWSQRVYERIGCPERMLLAADLRQATKMMLE